MGWGDSREQTSLTLIVDANVKALKIAIHDRAETREGVRSGLQFANLSRIPAFVVGEAVLLDVVAGVEEVHADLLSLAPGDGSQGGEGNSAEGGCIVGPHAVDVDALTDGATGQLVEESKRPEPRGDDGETRSWDRESHEKGFFP